MKIFTLSMETPCVESERDGYTHSVLLRLFSFIFTPSTFGFDFLFFSFFRSWESNERKPWNKKHVHEEFSLLHLKNGEFIRIVYVCVCMPCGFFLFTFYSNGIFPCNRLVMLEFSPCQIVENKKCRVCV